ncbi:nucleoporin-domain-containing protein [Basidiobolus meristosporus CBS 931.73]|uniref:Nucleoporin-domain-containing protein n=1 Tax=Basidiobolus meristosporus CBS 931.73 TaxID=1314790 RepID=A0A1Y1YV87_9FUNG|nr:nucleoporin-domain-containing protein [Basidiobolus meristosporus CBS 931.73]|eukprot:ORY01953.1 nucleoporin-domain-containing protein [Basidiobolus meristosporus CBS 931.73]
MNTVEAYHNTLNAAAKTLDTQLISDSKYPELADLLGSSSSEYSQPQTLGWQLFQKKRLITLPDALFEQYDLLQCRCFMGFFPEINRAWITVDHRLFLWNYLDGNDFYTYEDQDQLITSIGLAKAKPGIFVEEVQYVLVLATPLEIILLGLSTTESSVRISDSKRVSTDITLYNTLLAAPSDNTTMTSIIGTKNARIFMCGSDGNIHELAYQAEEGWFTKKCHVINHTSSTYCSLIPTFMPTIFKSPEDPFVFMALDEVRNILYGLTRQSNIEVMYLGQDGDQFIRVAKMTNICQCASQLCPTSPLVDARSFQLVSLHPIYPSESKLLNLVGVTSTGCRLYFTHHKSEFRGMGGVLRSDTKSPPTGLELLHVRLPPSPEITPNAIGEFNRSLGASNVHVTCYSSGVLLAANSVSDEMDSLLGMAPDAGKITQMGNQSQSCSLIEFHGINTIEGKTWAINEIENPFPSNSNDDERVMNELATQLTFPPRHFLVLTNSGINILSKQRPIDVFVQLLHNPSTQEADLLSFIDNYGKAQICAMCLAIVCGHPAVSGSTQTKFQSAPFGHQASNNQTSVLGAKAVYIKYGGRPSFVESPTYTHGGSGVERQTPTQDFIYSGQHDGLALYIARLIKPIWKKPFIRVTDKGFDLAVSVSVLYSIQQNLSNVEAFLKESPYCRSQPYSSLPAGYKENDAMQLELQSIKAMEQLLTQCVEGISFTILLLDCGLSDIMHGVSSIVQNQILELTFENLLISVKGRELRRDIVATIIDKQTAQGGGVQSVSDMLRTRCGSFCTLDDVTLFQAIECLKQAKTTNDPEKRMQILRDSLSLFKQVARHISLEKLHEICEEYKLLRFYVGAVELGLAYAKEQDPEDHGIAYFLDNATSSAEFYKKRIRYYGCVFSTLQAVNNVYHQTKVSSDDTGMTLEEAELFRNKVFLKALASDDLLFHHQLYDWYIGQNLIEELLDIQTPYLEAYLQKEPLTLRKLDLLWQYYAKNGRYGSAARVQSRLAESIEYGLSLADRIEYLTLAVGNSKSTSGRKNSSQFLAELEEKQEVALVQLDIYNAIKSSGDHLDSLGELDTQLFDITQLYNKFAFPFKLYESMLLIFYTSDYHDPEYIAQIWGYIIQQTHEQAQNSNIASHKALSRKVKQIGKKYYPSNVFPLAKICDLLERHNLKNHANAEPGWIVSTLHEIGVPYTSLLEILHSMFETKLPPWQAQASLEFLFKDIYLLLHDWLHSGNLKNKSSEQFPAKLADESITKYLVTLAATESPLIPKFYEIQRRIRRQY